jgi:hypothetical protein
MITPNLSIEHVEKGAARSFVLTCLRSGVRIDLKPQKSTTGLIAHVSASVRQFLAAVF